MKNELNDDMKTNFEVDTYGSSLSPTYGNSDELIEFDLFMKKNGKYLITLDKYNKIKGTKISTVLYNIIQLIIKQIINFYKCDYKINEMELKLLIYSCLAPFIDGDIYSNPININFLDKFNCIANILNKFNFKLCKKTGYFSSIFTDYYDEKINIEIHNNILNMNIKNINDFGHVYLDSKLFNKVYNNYDNTNINEANKLITNTLIKTGLGFYSSVQFENHFTIKEDKRAQLRLIENLNYETINFLTIMFLDFIPFKNIKLYTQSFINYLISSPIQIKYFENCPVQEILNYLKNDNNIKEEIIIIETINTFTKNQFKNLSKYFGIKKLILIYVNLRFNDTVGYIIYTLAERYNFIQQIHINGNIIDTYKLSDYAYKLNGSNEPYTKSIFAEYERFSRSNDEYKNYLNIHFFKCYDEIKLIEKLVELNIKIESIVYENLLDHRDISILSNTTNLKNIVSSFKMCSFQHLLPSDNCIYFHRNRLPFEYKHIDVLVDNFKNIILINF